MTIDELSKYGLERMTDEAIETFLDDHALGVLGLPTDDVPYMLPLSYVYDDGRLYFTYLLGESSRKESLTARARSGRFLVYDAETAFKWQSVMLTGDIAEVPESEWGALPDHPKSAWRPSVLQSATTSGGVKVYGFEIRERDGIRQTGLAPRFRENIEP